MARRPLQVQLKPSQVPHNHEISQPTIASNTEKVKTCLFGFSLQPHRRNIQYYNHNGDALLRHGSPPQNLRCVLQVCRRTGVQASKRPPWHLRGTHPSQSLNAFASLTTRSPVCRMGQSQAWAHIHQTVANFMLPQRVKAWETVVVCRVLEVSRCR